MGSRVARFWGVLMSTSVSQAADVVREVVYKPSGGLRAVLMVTFFLLVVFILNALVGAIWLASNNLWTDATIFSLLFIIGTAMLLFAGVFLFMASHAKVHLGPEKLVAVLPNWRGPTPLLPYTQLEIPYKDIAAVEKRGEIYRYYILPVLVEATCFVRRDGKRFTLGYVRANASEHSIPYHEIADEIGRRAGVGVKHRGVVNAGRRVRAMIQDEPPWDAEVMNEEEAARLQKAEARAWKYAIVALAVLIGGGVVFQGISLVTAKLNLGAAEQTASRPASNR